MPKIALRDYQEEALAAIEDAYLRGVQRMVVALPTGGGKTIVFASDIERRGGRALVLAHRDELIRQAVEKLEMVYPGAHVGVVKAERDEWWADIVVGSVQTLSQPKRLARLHAEFATVVIDEAHHAPAASYRTILDQVGAFQQNGPVTVGYTATPERMDGQGLDSVFEEIVYQKQLLDLIDAGHLCDGDYTIVKVEVDFGEIATRGGDFVESSSGKVLLEANAPRYVVEAYRAHAAGRKTLIFTPTVALAYEMAEAFAAAGYPAEAVDGTTSTAERHAIFSRFSSGETLVLANCGIATEGYDEPSIECVIVARPTKSRPLYLQMIGRATRKHPSKTKFLVLDVVGIGERHGLVTAEDILTRQPSSRTGEWTDRTVSEPGDAVQPDLFSGEGKLISREVAMFRANRAAWNPVADAPGSWVLAKGDGLVIMLKDNTSHYTVFDLSKDPLKAPATVAKGLTLEYAQGVAEDHVRTAGAGGLINPRAKWRAFPPSDPQVKFARRMGIPIREGMSMGELSDLIASTTAIQQLRRLGLAS